MCFIVSAEYKSIVHSVAPSTITGASVPSSIYNEGKEEDCYNMIPVLLDFVYMTSLPLILQSQIVKLK